MVVLDIFITFCQIYVQILLNCLTSELHFQVSDLDAVIGSVSGGGLVAGMALAAKVWQILIME